MKKISLLLACAALCGSLTSCYERVDAGHEGVKVNLYGDKKGVDDVSLVTGANGTILDVSKMVK